MAKTKERKLAEELFATSTRTQKEIAEMVGVSENTLTKWVAEGGWEKLRAARLSTPAAVIDNMVEIHLLRTQQILAEMRAGTTNKYGDELLKMSQAIEKMKAKLSVGTYIQVLTELMAGVPATDRDFRRRMSEYQSAFLTSKAAD